MAISSKSAFAKARRGTGTSFSTEKKEVAGRNGRSGTARLAEFFPGAFPMQVPATVERREANQEAEIQAVIEFGTAREVIFSCRASLEIGESLRIYSPSCSLDATAKVVAIQVANEDYALAVRFTGGAKNWIIRE